MRLLEIEDWRRKRLAPPDSTFFSLDVERRLVLVRFGKTISFSDIKDYASKLLAHPQFHPNYSEIADLCKVEQLKLGPEEFIKLADEVDPFSFEAKRAFVVSNSVQAHAARMHKALRIQRNFSIFHSVDEAERWIEE